MTNRTQGPDAAGWTRRGFGLAAGLAVAAAVAGCGRAVIGLDPKTLSLDIGNGAEPLSLDPQKASGQWENNIIGNLLMGLTQDDLDALPVPGMAERWETSADGIVWTFHLRDAVWSDGAPVTAYDFEYAYRRLLHPETIAEYASIQYPIKNAKRLKSWEAEKEGRPAPMEELGVKALDAKTVEITLEHPAPYLPGLLKHYTAFPIPKHVVEKVGDAWTRPENIVVNGPFTLAKWWSNSLVHLKKNPRFYEADQVQLNELFFYPTSDDDAAARRVIRGELAWSTRFPGKKQDFYDREIPGFARVAPWMLCNYFSLNTRKAPFNDPRVRQAVSMAINRQFLCEEIWKAGYQPAYSFVPPGMYNWPQGGRMFFADWPMDKRLEEARRLLEAAGYGPEKPLRFTFNHRNSSDNPRIAVVVQSNWRRIAPWVEVDLRGTEVQIHYANLRAANFEAGDGGWIADYNDPKNYLYLGHSSTGAQNYPGFNNPEYDRLMDASDDERDALKRAGLMREAEQLMIDLCPIVPVSFGSSTNLLHPRIGGWKTNLEDTHRARYMRITDL